MKVPHRSSVRSGPCDPRVIGRAAELRSRWVSLFFILTSAGAGERRRRPPPWRTGLAWRALHCGRFTQRRSARSPVEGAGSRELSAEKTVGPPQFRRGAPVVLPAV